MPKEENNGWTSKPEPHETYRCARRGGCVEGETTSTEVALEDKGLASCGCCAVVSPSRVYDRSNGEEDGSNEDR